MPSNFGFTNVTPSTHDITPISIGLVSNYAKISDEPTFCELQNKTAPLDQGELVTVRANNLKKVSSTQIIQNPLPVRNGIQYVVKVESILRTTNSAGTVIGDEPIVAYVTIRHQKSGNITSALVDQMFTRLLGACYKSDGTTRFNDLMRSAIVPTVD